MIEEEWNEKKILSQKEPIDSVDTYWKNKSSLPNYMGVDFITWRDLSMDEVYQKINYTQTSVGSEFLYHQLHEIQLTNQDRDESFYELIKTNREIC